MGLDGGIERGTIKTEYDGTANIDNGSSYIADFVLDPLGRASIHTNIDIFESNSLRFQVLHGHMTEAASRRAVNLNSCVTHANQYRL